MLAFAQRSCPLLEELYIWSCRSNQQVEISGAGVFTLIGRNFKHLRKLTLASCELSVSILRNVAGIEALKELTLDNCGDLTDEGMIVLAMMKLEYLSLCVENRLTEAALEAFVGSNISRTLATFELKGSGDDRDAVPLDDDRVATALASCHNLKRLHIDSFFGYHGCLFGRNGLDGLQALAAGCPLLADVALHLTTSGIHCLGTHCANLKECYAISVAANRAPGQEEFPPVEELRTLYPAVEWGLIVL
jgi:hypothetical protein